MDNKNSASEVPAVPGMQIAQNTQNTTNKNLNGNLNGNLNTNLSEMENAQGQMNSMQTNAGQMNAGPVNIGQNTTRPVQTSQSKLSGLIETENLGGNINLIISTDTQSKTNSMQWQPPYEAQQVQSANAAMERIRQRIEGKVSGKLTLTQEEQLTEELRDQGIGNDTVEAEAYAGLTSVSIMNSGDAKEKDEVKRQRIASAKLAQQQEKETYDTDTLHGRQLHSEFYTKKKRLLSDDIRRTGGANSTEMETFKQWIAQMTQMWQERFDPQMEDAAFATKKLIFLKIYDETIAAGHAYARNKNPYTLKGKKRLAAVRELTHMLEEERAQFEEATRQYREAAGPEKAAKSARYHTWADLLYDVRAIELEGGMQALTVGSTGSTKKIQVGGKEHFYKPAQYLESKGADNFEEFLKLYPEAMEHEDYVSMAIRLEDAKFAVGDISSESDEVETMAEKIKSGLDAIITGPNPVKAAKEVAALYDKCVTKNLREITKLSKLTKVVDDLRIISGVSTQEKPLTEQDQAKREEYLKNQAIYGSAYGTLAIAEYNRIAEGSNLSNRSVATSRVAELFGMGDVVVKTKTCYYKTKTGDKVEYHNGVLMEKAEGMSYGMLMEEYNAFLEDHYLKAGDPGAPQIYWTQTASKQYMHMLLLDILCGQGDRHLENFMVVTEKLKNGSYIIRSVKGIDNDMSFGTLSEDMIKAGFNRTLPLDNGRGRINLSYIDEETYTRIKDMSEAQLRLVVADLGLPEQELKAMCDRLKLLQQYVREEARINPEFVVKNNTLPAKKMRHLVKGYAPNTGCSIRGVKDDAIISEDQIREDDRGNRVVVPGEKALSE